MDKVKEQLYEALKDAEHLCRWILQSDLPDADKRRCIREKGIDFKLVLAAYEQEKAAEQHCPACAMGQSLGRGEGTHLEGTAEHPRHEFIGSPQVNKSLEERA